MLGYDGQVTFRPVAGQGVGSLDRPADLPLGHDDDDPGPRQPVEVAVDLAEPPQPVAQQTAGLHRPGKHPARTADEGFNTQAPRPFAQSIAVERAQPAFNLKASLAFLTGAIGAAKDAFLGFDAMPGYGDPLAPESRAIGALVSGSCVPNASA